MNNEDMSEIIQKLSNMMNHPNHSSSEQANQDMSSQPDDTSFEHLQEILSKMNFHTEEQGNEEQNTAQNFHFDFETIMKMKKIMDQLNTSQNSPETRLLLSLKPYLNSNRKQKLDQYIQFLNITKVIESLNANGGVNSNDGQS